MESTNRFSILYRKTFIDRTWSNRKLRTWEGVREGNELTQKIDDFLPNVFQKNTIIQQRTNL